MDSLAHQPAMTKKPTPHVDLKVAGEMSSIEPLAKLSWDIGLYAITGAEVITVECLDQVRFETWSDWSGDAESRSWFW